MKKEKDITLRQAAANNLYAIKLLWSVSRRRVIHMALTSFLGYMTWMFYSVFFMRYIASATQNETPFSTIFTYIVIVCLVTLIIGLYNEYANNVVFPLDDVTVYSKLYGEIYRKAENVELSCYEDSSFYDKYTMAVDGASDKVIETVRLLCEVFAAMCAGMVTYVAMFQIDKLLILFVLAPFIGNFVFGALQNKIQLRMYKEIIPFTRRTEYVNRVMYLSDYAKEMRLSQIYNVLENTYNNAARDNIKIAKKYRTKNIAYGFGQFYFSYTIIFEGILLYGAYSALVAQTLTLSQFAVLVSMMWLASWALISTANNLMACNKNGMFLHNLRSFMNHKETIPENQDGIMPSGEVKSVEFKNVSFGYKAGSPVIKNMSFTLGAESAKPDNKSIALVGHNGAGKTTIIKLLLRLYDPTEGEVLVNGINVKDYNLKAYRNLFAAAFQDYKIFADSVRENVLMGRGSEKYEQDEEIVLRSLESARVADKVSGLPGGTGAVLTKEFDEDGQVLSGGEFQKIVVARAFANPAPIKVFDEPSSALDPIAEHELFESILEESRNNLTIFISHRLSSVKNADEVIMLEHGEIIERGTHADLLENNGKYADMFTKQAKNYQPAEYESEVIA
ncbi:MAG: ABC transporter ATP-binding protein/permease [Oscillospiraceae bacterium]|jgi:ATP-binding cassette subfamily B protein|nr:ABC transporter ATP-binding protein/permease [Oscillospiraceae bacterium]